MNKKTIDINYKYGIVITYNNDITRYYRLIDKISEDTIVESFNRDSFLLKVRNYVKLTSVQENLVASV